MSESIMIDPALGEPAPGLDPAAREAWIQEMTRLTDNEVDKVLHRAMASEATLRAAITDILHWLLKSIMSTVSVARLGTRRYIRIGPVDLSIMPSGISYKETEACKNFKACVARVTSQDEIDRLAALSSRSRTGMNIIDAFLDDMLVSNSGASSSTASFDKAQTIGPYKPNLGVTADDIVTQTIILFAFLEVKFAKLAVIQGTRLESPLTRALLTEEYKPLPSAVKLEIKRGAAQAIWYGCVITEMAHNDPAVPADQPILGMLMINGWFVRIRFHGNTVFVESDVRAGQSCSPTEFLQDIKKGEGFPHNIVIPEGAAAMYTYIVAATNEIVRLVPATRQIPTNNTCSAPMEEKPVHIVGLNSEPSEVDQPELSCKISPDNVSLSPNSENPQAYDHDFDFDGDDAQEYEAAKEPERLVELLESAWTVEFCSIRDFDRLLQRL